LNYSFYKILSLIFLFLMLNEAGADTLTFKNAVSVTTDSKGFIYVLDNDANEIIKLSSDLSLVKRIGKKGWGYGEFDTPTYIDGSTGLDIYVCDGKNFRIQRFDLNLSFISALLTNTETFDNSLKFNKPLASVIVNSNDLYVIDGDNYRIVKFQDSKIPVISFAGFQDINGSLSKPVKFLKDGYNNLYVLDKGRNSIMQYDNFGNYIKAINYDTIVSFSIYKDILFILNSNLEIVRYDVKKGAFIDRFASNVFLDAGDVKDFLVYNSEKFIILEKGKINFYKY